MNWLDIVIIVILAINAFTGLKNGIIKAALSLAGVVVGIILAGRYYVVFSGRLTFIPQENVARIVAFVIILIVVMLIAGVLAALLKKVASAIMLGWLNHLGGAVFGLGWGVILCGALLALWVKYFGMNETITESTLSTVLLDRFPMVLSLLPDEFDTIRSFFK